MAGLVYKRKQVHFVAESTPGTPNTTSMTAINVYDFKVPDWKADFLGIDGQRGFGNLGGVLGARSGEFSFKFDVTFKSAADPAWMNLLAGCGYALSTGVWTPTSAPPGASGGSSCLTFRFQQDGREQVVAGCCGSIKFSAVAGGKIVAEATFKGIPSTPSDASFSTLTLPSGETVARFASVSSLTIGGTSLTVAELSLDLGVDVSLIEDASTASGYKHAVPVNAKPSGTVVMLAGLNSGFRPLLRAIAGTTGAFAWKIGSSGAGIDVAGPALQFTGEQSVDRNGILYDSGAFVLNRSAGAGDDALTFDGTAA